MPKIIGYFEGDGYRFPLYDDDKTYIDSFLSKGEWEIEVYKEGNFEQIKVREKV